MIAAQGSTKRPKRLSSWRLLGQFAIACALTYGVELWLDRALEESGQSQNVLTESLFGLASLYHRIVTASPRKPSPRFTTLITLSGSASPPGVSLLNTCQERQFLGELLKTLANIRPNVVLIDKYFGATTCPTGDPGTRNLLDGTQVLCLNHIRLIVGRKISNDALNSKKKDSNPYPVDAALSFDSENSCVAEAVLNIGLDLRRVVLWWPNVEPFRNLKQPPPSIAFATAQAAAATFLESGRLSGWTPYSPLPYVSFVERGQFEARNVAARELVCGSAAAPGWRACEDNEIRPEIRALLQSRVVVIGEDFPDVDRHETVVGDIPGYMVQANYIESLLDDRLIRPLPQLFNVGAGLIFFLCFEYLVWRYHHHRLKAFVYMSALFLGTGLIIYLSVTLLGYYLNPIAISLFAVLLRVADLAVMPASAPEAEDRT